MNTLKNIFVPKEKPKTIKFRSAEQKYHLISIFTENDGVYKTTEQALINLIVDSGMNLQNLWTYNDSPLRDDDPAFDVFTEIEHDPKEFLNNNFELVCQSYLNQFNK